MALFSFMTIIISQANTPCHPRATQGHPRGHKQPADHEYDTLGYFIHYKYTIIEYFVIILEDEGLA